MTPLLILVFGVKPVTAIGTDIFYAAVTKTAGGWRHLKLKTVNMPLTWWMAAGSVPSAIAGVWVLGILKDKLGDELDETVFAILASCLLVVGAITLLRSLFLADKLAERDDFEIHTRHKVAAVAIGATTGFVIGLSLGGQRHRDRDHADRRLPPDPEAGGRHRRLPRRDPAVGGGHRPRLQRQRRLRPGREHPGRLGPRRDPGVEHVGEVAPGRAAHGARTGPDRRRAWRCSPRRTPSWCPMPGRRRRSPSPGCSRSRSLLRKEVEADPDEQAELQHEIELEIEGAATGPTAVSRARSRRSSPSEQSRARARAALGA